MDIIGIAETHLKGSDVLHVPGYQWFGQNRTALHHRARAGSGGVGFLVSECIVRAFNVSILDDATEGILWLQLQSKEDNFTYNVCVCYLPPENTTRDVDAQDFFETLLSHMHLFNNDGRFFICGDFNARCGDLDDFIGGVDDIPPRDVVDQVVNDYGEFLCNLLVSSNCCLLNGRNCKRNDFTSISNRGRAVVDYCPT